MPNKRQTYVTYNIFIFHTKGFARQSEYIDRISGACLCPFKQGQGQMFAGRAGSGKMVLLFCNCLLENFKLTRPSVAFGVWKTYKGIFEK